jgi:hypothetical protein
LGSQVLDAHDDDRWAGLLCLHLPLIRRRAQVLAGDADVKVRKAAHGNRSAPGEAKAIAALMGI